MLAIIHRPMKPDFSTFCAAFRRRISTTSLTVPSRLSEIFPYKYPASLRRHYENLNRFPEGYLVLGDAFASFNPIYGQGMTSAALQAQVLDEILKRRRSLHGLWRLFFRGVQRL